MRIAIIGGGFLGACLALELARRGVRSDVLERQDECLSQTGAKNEGKVHLGYVFANDTSFRTATLMQTGASVFETCLRNWTGISLDSLVAMRNFYYAVHRNSIVAPDDLEQRYRQIARAAEDIFSAQDSYFGRNPTAAPIRLSAAETENYYSSELISAAFSTQEVAVDPAGLADILRHRLNEEPLITVHKSTCVKNIDLSGRGPVIHAETPDGIITIDYDHAINASWEDQISLDRSAGIIHDGGVSYRVKYFLRYREVVERDIASTTIVLGPFGDIVNFGKRGLFLSWYPVGRRGMWKQQPPKNWRAMTDPSNDPNFTGDMIRALSEIQPIILSETNASREEPVICGGLILALGLRDISDPASGLHSRTSIGIRSYGRYHSINVGKWTTAPIFAKLFAEQLLN